MNGTWPAWSFPAPVPGTAEEAREELAWELGLRRLVTAAATSGSLGVLLPFAAAATQWGDDLFGSKDSLFDESADSVI